MYLLMCRCSILTLKWLSLYFFSMFGTKYEIEHYDAIQMLFKKLIFILFFLLAGS